MMNTFQVQSSESLKNLKTNRTLYCGNFPLPVLLRKKIQLPQYSKQTMNRPLKSSESAKIHYLQKNLIRRGSLRF